MIVVLCCVKLVLHQQNVRVKKQKGEKMKKLMIGIAGIMAMVASVNAADTDKIKAACQASDKTLWVERNKVCIPKNPCKDEKFEAYCNRTYKDYQCTETYEYQVLVAAYALGHNLSCTVLESDSHLVGQDYVICAGDDVMVFEFDDINDTRTEISAEQTAERRKEYKRMICEAVGGACNSKSECLDVSETLCHKLEKELAGYHSPVDAVVSGENRCWIGDRVELIK